MAPNPATDPVSVFDEYATLVREKYAMLDFKGVNIDQLADSIRATIQPGISDDELFGKLAIITARLRDAHSSLIENKNDTLGLIADFDLLAGYPSGFDGPKLINNYLLSTINPNIKVLEGGAVGFRMLYGPLNQAPDIAYCWVPSWNEEITDAEIEAFFASIKDSKGLVLDMRINGGGDPTLATKFASYFTDKAIPAGFERFKTGPGKNDFSDSPAELQPSGSANTYLKPVIILTDRNVYSASTTFLYMVDPLPQIKTMGQRTGGGSGSVAEGFLANGWFWSLSSSEFIDAQGRHLDDGVEPDIPVALDLTVTTKDEVLERAILELQ